jgi:DNA-binding GntR family transcriptional regulator
MPFAPGESGNPGGRPKRAKLWQDAILRAIKRREQDDPQALEKLADKLLSQVDAGDVAAMREFGDRIDGKVAQALEMSGSLELSHEERLARLK